MCRLTLVLLVLVFYAAIGTCLVLIIEFEAGWDRGDPVTFPEHCRGITSDPGVLVGFGTLGVLIGLLLCA